MKSTQFTLLLVALLIAVFVANVWSTTGDARKSEGPQISKVKNARK
jgi:hypothetical protein